VLDFDGGKRARRRDAALGGGVLLLALTVLLLPATYQEPIRAALRSTILRPFIAAQAQLAQRRSRVVDVGQLRAERDSLAAVVAAQEPLVLENRQLRSLLRIADRLGQQFRPANVLRLGTAGAESTFLVDVGSADGVKVGSPVLTAEGVLGVVWEVHEHMAEAIDWTQPQFVVSAMTADGEAYGLVEARQGRFREEDLLVLTGTPFHSDVRPGRRVVASGRGQVFPRGVMIGTVLGIDQADTGWRKSYLLQPAVRPEAARQVLVGVAPAGDLSEIWHVAAPPDPALRDSTRTGALGNAASPPEPPGGG